MTVPILWPPVTVPIRRRRTSLQMTLMRRVRTLKVSTTLPRVDQTTSRSVINALSDWAVAHVWFESISTKWRILLDIHSRMKWYNQWCLSQVKYCEIQYILCHIYPFGLGYLCLCIRMDRICYEPFLCRPKLLWLNEPENRLLVHVG